MLVFYEGELEGHPNIPLFAVRYSGTSFPIIDIVAIILIIWTFKNGKGFLSVTDRQRSLFLTENVEICDRKV